MKSSAFILRKGQPQELAAIQQLFLDTVTMICSNDYNQEQIEAWVSTVEDHIRWLDVVKKQYLLVVEQNEKIVGFGSLKKGSHIDLIYVHKDFQGQGIAKMLFSGLEQEAKRKGQTNITSDVSISARPFFEKIGFIVIKKQTVFRNDVKFKNYKMEKKLVTGSDFNSHDLT